MLRFTLYQEDGDIDPGDITIDPAMIGAVILGERGGKLLATLFTFAGIKIVVHDPDRDAQDRVARAKEWGTADG